MCVPRRNCFSYLFKPDEPYLEPQYVYTHKLLWCCVHTRTQFQIFILFVLAKIFYVFARKKKPGPLFEIDRKLVPYRPERRRRRHHHYHRGYRRHRRTAAAAGSGGGIACYKNTNNYNYPSFRNTLKDAATRAIRHTIGRRGRNKKKYRTIYILTYITYIDDVKIYLNITNCMLLLVVVVVFFSILEIRITLLCVGLKSPVKVHIIYK